MDTRCANSCVITSRSQLCVLRTGKSQVVVVNLMLDLLYLWIDPRIRLDA
jgi:hypothetical protein